MSDPKNDSTTSPAPSVPAPKLADGLFKPFTLGSTLEQSASGNVLSNMKPSPMDYEKAYQGSTKNQTLSPEDLAKIGTQEVKKAQATEDEILAAIPPEHRDGVLFEMDKRLDEARKSSNTSEVDRIEKAKEKAKKCWGPQMDRKQPKA